MISTDDLDLRILDRATLSEAAISQMVDRRRRRELGFGIVTPKRPLEVLDGHGRRTEVLQPGRDRIQREHEWVAAQPQLFRAFHAADTATTRMLAERAARVRNGGRRPTRQITPPGSSPKPPYCGSGSRRPSRVGGRHEWLLGTSQPAKRPAWQLSA